MFFIITTFLSLYKERRRANRAIAEFKKFVEEARERIKAEEEEEQKSEGEEKEEKSQPEEPKRASRWRRAGARVKACCAWIGSGKWKPTNKILIELLFMLGLFLMMQAIGTLFYVVIALKFSTYSQATGTFVGIGIQAVMFLILLSRHLRVIFFVTLPSMVGSRVRTILVIMMLIWAFQFPAQNVTSNIQSAMEGVNCVSQRVKEVADEVKERAGHTFHDAPINQMRDFLREQAKPFEGIRQTMRNLDDSLEKMVAWQRELIGKIQNLMQNCSHMAQLPFKACVGWLNERHAACQERFFEMVCQPIHLVKALCYVTKVLELHCEWPSRVKGSIKEGVTSFVKGAKRRASDYARETFMYDIYNSTWKQGKLAFDTLEIAIDHEHNYTEQFELDKEKIHDELHKEIAAFERFLDIIVLALDVLMILLTIWPFFVAVLYVRNFQKSDSLDNHYIDSHFIEIDKARAINGQPTLLPLLPKEKKMYISTCSVRMRVKEKLLMCLQHVFLLFSVLPIGIFILVDIFVYKLIRKAFVFFHGEGAVFPTPSIYKLKISGDGYLNQMLASILHTFEPLTDAQGRDQMWRQCFQEPTPPNYELFQVIFLIYLLCVVLIFLQTYLKRTKHLIALHYFPERAHPRALYLYNKILTKRMQMWDMMTDIKKSKDGEDVIDSEKQLLYKGLSVLSEDKQQCYRCARADLSVQEIANIRLCVRCHAIYCVDCYLVRQRCLRKDCRAPLQTITEDVDLYVDSSCEDNDDEDDELGSDSSVEYDISYDNDKAVPTSSRANELSPRPISSHGPDCRNPFLVQEPRDLVTEWEGWVPEYDAAKGEGHVEEHIVK